MDTKAILAQSEAAYKQWAVQWREHAKFHSKFPMHSMLDLENSGVGRAILCVANGYSFEENLEIIKKHQHNVDIMACDKTLGHLLANGITPKYMMLCDANVSFDKYLAPYLDKLSEITLFANVCGNPKWVDGIKWKKVYFFANKDILESEKEFCALSGCPNVIPAGTNVSNAMVVLLSQSDNSGRKNFFGYDKILLIGFDYSWRHGKSYYAFDKDGGGKDHYMCHAYLVTNGGEFGYTSGNLAFSAEWLATYAKAFNLPLVQCSRGTITQGIQFGDLETCMQYRYKVEDGIKVKESVKRLRRLDKEKKELLKELATIGQDHWFNHIATS